MTSAARGPATIGMVCVVVVWATQMPLSQEVLRSIDQYSFAILRYLIGCSLFVATLAWREGRAGFDLGGRAGAVVWHGVCGFTVFGIFVFWALYYTTPAHVAVIMSLQPMIIAFWMWARHGRAPTPPVLACIGIAFVGAALMITRGDPMAALAGGSATGDAMALLGAAGWVVYTLGAARLPGFSPLKYTTLCALAGTAGIVILTALLVPLDLARIPTRAEVMGELWAIVYIAVVCFYGAILMFTVGVARLGAVNALLIGNATPVLVFAIDVWRGLAPLPIEWLGAAMVVSALVANNLIEARRTRAAS
ncbi:MAG: DMT family transporter [Burkholderiales bacterium]|nr:DMT family transporter [Burkholderiales bacterium]